MTVLSSDDPVRVFQRFSTLDAVSSGRAEVILGRGSFTESFPLFGYALEQYEQLFEEKLELFAELLKERPGDLVAGRRAPPLTDQTVYPPTALGRLPTWIGVGGSPESVVRAARYGLPLMLAIIGGEPMRFAPYVDLYHRALDGVRSARPLPVGVHSPGHVAAHRRAGARRAAGRTTRQMHATIGRERGWPPMSRAQFEREAGPDGALFVGSPETVAAKIVATVAGARARALRHEVQRRDAAARAADAQHRALRQRGRAARARAPGRGVTPHTARVPRPIILDCDPGHDDAIALLLALASPEVELLGVTTVHGNQTLAKTTANALRVLDLAGRDDIAGGAPAPTGRWCAS